MMSVSIETEPELTSGRPDILFEASYAGSRLSTNYDVAPNEEGFIMIQREQTGTYNELDVVLHWFEN